MDNRSDDRIAGWRRYERDLAGHLRPLGAPPPIVTSTPPRRAGAVLILALLLVFIVAGLAVTFYLEQSPETSIADLFGDKPAAFQATGRGEPVTDRPATKTAESGQANVAPGNRPGDGGERPFAGATLNLDPRSLAAPGTNGRAADRRRPGTAPEPAADVPAAVPNAADAESAGRDSAHVAAGSDTVADTASDTPAATETDTAAAPVDAGEGSDESAAGAAADTLTTDATTAPEATTTDDATPDDATPDDAPAASAEATASADDTGADRPNGAAADSSAGDKTADGGASASAAPADAADAAPRSFADIVRAALGGDTSKPTPPKAANERAAADEQATPPAVDRAATREPVTHDGAVARALLTTNVRDREPVDRVGPVVDLPSGGGTLYFFTELKGLGGRSVTHDWFYGRTSVQSVTLRIGSDRWRTYTKKRIDPNTKGAWRVVLTDQAGRVLASEAFEVR